MPEEFDKTDAVLARKLGEIAPPADLRARLLASASSEQATPEVVEAGQANWWARGIMALAALLIVAISVLNVWPHRGSDSIMVATADLSSFLSNGFALEMKTSDVGKVRKWLVARNPDHPVSLPQALMQNPPMGCREINWHDHVGSLACFSLGDGKEAHLAMFPTRIFSDAPGDTPKIASAGAWTRAAWSKDGMTYLLFVSPGVDPMQELSAALERLDRGLMAFGGPLPFEISTNHPPSDS